jgi:tetratricopeptide (TPR) repeat protein
MEITWVFFNVIEDYGMTDAAKLANYYAGVAYLKQGKFQVARLYLEDFSSNDLLVQARAYSLIGDTYMEEQNFEDAAKYYQKLRTISRTNNLLRCLSDEGCAGV